MTLKSIKIHSIRGIKELDIELGNKGTIIYGENGSGKTSIVDAFEFLFSGSISHLKAAKTLSFKEYGTHIYKDKEPEVAVTFLDDNKVVRSVEKKHKVPKLLTEYFKNAENGKIILRRSQILDFIHEQPSNRYKSFGGLLGLDALDHTESLFKKAMDKLKIELGDCKNRIEYEYDTLSYLLNKEIKSTAQLLIEINNVLSSKNKPILKSLNDIFQYRIDISTQSIENKQHRLIDLNNSLSRLQYFDLDEISYMSYNFKILLDKFFKKSTIIGNSFLLQTAKKIIENAHVDRCPVCDRDIQKDKLIDEIDNKVKYLEDYERDLNEIRYEGEEIKRRFEALENELLTIREIKNDIFDISISKQVFETLTNLKSIINGILELKNNLNYDKFDEDLRRLNVILKIQELLEKEINIIEKKYIQEDNETIELLNQVDDKLFMITKYEEEYHKKLGMYNLAVLLYSKYSEVKKRGIQNIYRDIQKDTEDFYSFIHPNEEHKNIQLIVDLSKKSNSVDIKMDSFQKEVDPRAYQSEGHLDSLGLCVFLAYIKKFNTDCNLLILDDIVSTIDSNHRNRICELIFEKFPEKQIIITTHDQIWYDQIISTQKKFKIENKFKNYLIKKWNVNTGMDLIPYKKRTEVIEEKLFNLDKQGAGNEIRQYLEYLLSEVCQKFIVKIPFKKNGRYMLNDYFENFGSRISQIKLNSNSQWRNDILKIYNELDSYRSVINLLSHYNENSNNISIEEIKSVFAKAKDFEKILSCVTCETLLEYDPTSKLIKCVNEKCKIKTIYQ